MSVLRDRGCSGIGGGFFGGLLLGGRGAVFWYYPCWGNGRLFDYLLGNGSFGVYESDYHCVITLAVIQ